MRQVKPFHKKKKQSCFFNMSNLIHIQQPDFFRYSFNNVEATLKQCATLRNVVSTFFQRCATFFGVASMSGYYVVSTLCNVEKATSDFVSFSTSDQRCFNNVDPTLKCWLETILKRVSKKQKRKFQSRIFMKIKISRLETSKTYQRSNYAVEMYSTFHFNIFHSFYMLITTH